MRDLSKGNIVVCGAGGFIGKHLIEELENRNIEYRALTKSDINFTNEGDFYIVHKLAPCDYLFNLIGYNGGIVFNKKNKANIFYENTVMNLNLLNAASKLKCKKVLSTLASCAYDSSSEECYENKEGLLFGSPHESVKGHGYAKRNVFLMSEMISEETETKCICVTPTTVFGPGDSLDERKSKVIGSLAIKFIKAKRNNDPFIQLLGDGRPLRHFIYVKDVTKLMIKAMEEYEDTCNPLHLASPTELSISSLAEKIASIVGYSGKLIWEGKESNGQFRKYLENHTYFNYTNFDDALKETIKWYEERI